MSGVFNFWSGYRGLKDGGREADASMRRGRVGVATFSERRRGKKL